MIIQAPPLPPYVPGYVRAAWTPQSVNGVIPDLSGMGKTGTPVGQACYECSPYYGSVLRNFGLDAGFTFSCVLGVTTAGTWMADVEVATLTTPAGGRMHLIEGNSNADYLALITNGSCFLRGALTLGGVARTLDDNLPARVGVKTFFAMTYDSNYIKLYIDGTLRQTSVSYGGAVITNWNAGTGRVGYGAAGTLGLDGYLRAPCVLNRCLSGDEIAALYRLR